MDRARIDAAFASASRKAHAGRIRPDAVLTGDRDHVERRGAGESFLLAKDGWRYRVYDVRVEAGRVKKARHEADRVTHRVFVSADGMKRTYTFGRGEVRTITAAILERQLATGKYLTAGPFANHATEPR